MRISKSTLNLALKLLIAGLLGLAIYRQVFAKQQVEELWAALVRGFVYPNLLWLVAVILLAPLNMALEAMKWRQLIGGFSKLGFWPSFKAVLAGTTIAIFTPNRVGEYGGRVLFVEEGQGWKAVIATMVGSLAQLLALLSVGLVGGVYFSVKFLQPEPYLVLVSISLGAAFLGLLFFTYFNIDVMVPLVKRIPYIERFKKPLRQLTVLRHYHRPELGRALGLAFLRRGCWAWRALRPSSSCRPVCLCLRPWGCWPVGKSPCSSGVFSPRTMWIFWRPPSPCS